MMHESAILVANAVMYEGAFLYPYRKSSIKNRYRWTFGVLPPRNAVGGALELTAACLLRGGSGGPVEVLLRFLTDDGAALRPRDVSARCAPGLDRVEFAFDGVAGLLVLERSSLGDGYERLRACVQNRTELDSGAFDLREAERRQSLHGVHVLLRADSAAHFVSLTDPPQESQPYAAHCEGRGLWCSVMGRDRARPDTALAAPVILPDFPAVAPESFAVLCDATEIDEILALRIRTLSTEEKREARATDPWVSEMLDRVESLSDAQLLRLHGARRRELETAHSGGAAGELHGARVKLKPRRSADAMDLLLAGRVAIVRSVERNVDGEVLLGVTLEDDPGSDLGAEGLPGHRFFFGLDEVTRLDAAGWVE
jgi:hypothetical protein